jgi:hypothetical protein
MERPYTVGRKYTRRLMISHEIVKQLGPERFGVDGDIARAVAWAEITLKTAGMPLDPVAAVYLDQTWWRQNARASLEWYAREILLAAHIFSVVRQGGSVDAVLNALWDLATLAAEGRFVEYNVCNSSSGGAEAKLSDDRQARTAKHEEWRIRAAELWAERPSRNQTAVAAQIDPDPKKRRNIIRTICDLDPRRRK